MRILFVSDSFPYPPDSGVKVRDYNLIRHLSRHCEVGLLAFVFSDQEEAGAAEMQRYCQIVQTVRFQRRPMYQHLPGVAKHLLTLQPLSNKWVYSPELAAKLAELTAAHQFDLVQIDCTPMAPYRVFVNGKNGNTPPTRTSLVFIDVNAHKYGRLWRHERSFNIRGRYLLDWLLMRRWEARYAAHFDVCVMMSELDAQRVKRRNPDINTAVIPNGVDVDEKRPLPDPTRPYDLLLVGTLTHPPWADAVQQFNDHIFPLICRQVPTVRMVIVGQAPPSIQALASERVIVTGWVESVEPYYRQTAVSVVPLRSGGGTRLKILESLAYGRPVVSTSIGCEGLELIDGHDLLVADQPDEFADQVVRLLTDGGLRRGVARNGRCAVEEKYSWATIADKLVSTYRQVCFG